MKKILSTIIAATITVMPLSTLSPIRISAEDLSASIKVETVYAKPGESVDVAVKISDNPGIVALEFKLDYDTDALELVSEPDICNLFSNGDYMFSGTLDTYPYSVSWADSLSRENYADTGDFVVLHFNVLDTAQADFAEISIEKITAVDVNLDYVTFESIKGGVEITATPNNPEKSSASIEVETAHSKPGESVDVAVKIPNNPGIVALEFKLDYDTDALELVSEPDICNLFSNGDYMFSGTLDTYPYSVSWADSLSRENYTDTGDFVVLHFNVLDTAQADFAEISIEKITAVDVNLDYVTFESIKGGVEIKKEETTTTTSTTTTTTTSTTTTTTEPTTTTTTSTTTTTTTEPTTTTTTSTTTTTTEPTTTTTTSTTTTTTEPTTTTTTSTTTTTTEPTTTTTTSTTTTTTEPTTTTTTSTTTTTTEPTTTTTSTTTTTTEPTTTTTTSTTTTTTESATISTTSTTTTTTEPPKNVTSGTCGETATWEFDSESGVLTISGSGDMYDYVYSYQIPWFDFEIKKIIINKGITRIGSDAFSSMYYLESVDIPGTVKSIGKSAFNYTDIPIDIPFGVEIIESYAFQRNDKIISLMIPNSVKEIGELVFSNCDSLETVYLPESVSTLGFDAFYSCDKLKSITIENPDCDIYDYENTISDTATIYGYKGSTAQEYAEKYNRTFIALDNTSADYEIIINQTNAFYFSIDTEFSKEQIKSIIYKTDSGETEITADMIEFHDTPENLFNPNSTEFRYNVPLYAAEDISDSNGNVIFKKGEMIADSNGNKAQFTVYIGVKGDADLDGMATAVDSSIILAWYADMATGGNPETTVFSNSEFVNDSDDILDTFAAFLADVDNDRVEGNRKMSKSDRKELDAIDASAILAMYSLTSTGSKPTRELWNETLYEDI